MNQFELIMQSNSLSFDTSVFANNMLAVLEKQDNFKLVTHSEISDIYLNEKTHVATGVKVIGKKEIPLDLLVVCTGASTARLIKHTLGVRLPLMPVKSYCFDIPYPLEYPKAMLSFKGFHATTL